MKGTFVTRPAGVCDSIGPSPHNSAFIEGRRDSIATVINYKGR